MELERYIYTLVSQGASMYVSNIYLFRTYTREIPVPGESSTGVRVGREGDLFNSDYPIESPNMLSRGHGATLCLFNTTPQHSFYQKSHDIELLSRI